MRTPRWWRQTAVCSVTLPLLFTLSVDGVAVDQSGSPLPRAFVRAVDASGHEIASTFTDESGHFRLTTETADCRLQVSLTGFTQAETPCAEAVKVVLPVAPVRESVVVSATRTEAPIESAGLSVSAFTAADIERRNNVMVTDLLRTTPGAMVVTTGAVGGVTSLFVRGGESNYNKVLLDGIPLNEPGGTFNFSNVTTDDLERVEIVRGAQSAIFGSDAMSSVVQLFTKRGTGPRPLVSGYFEGGTYDTVRGGASVAGAHGILDYSVGAAYISTDNNEPNDAFANTTATANVGVKLGGSATLRGIARIAREHDGTPGQTAFERPDSDAHFDRHDGAGGVAFDQQVTDHIRQRASYSAAVSHQESADLVADPSYTPRLGNDAAPFAYSDFVFDSFDSLTRHYASYQADIRLANDSSTGYQLLTALVDWDGERATLLDRLANASTPASRDNVGIAVQHQAQWRRVSGTVGLRFEHNDSFGNQAVPRGSVALVAYDGTGTVGITRIHAAAGLGVKEPTILQSFSTSPYFHGNPDLRPEKARSVEAGVDQRLFGDRARVDLTWFDSRYEDLIALGPSDPVTFASQYFNIGLSQARGLELSADAAPARALRIHGGYTFLSSEVLDSTSAFSIVFAEGKPLLRRPRHSGFVDAAWHAGPFSASLVGTFIGEFADSDFASFTVPLTTNPGFTTWDVRLSYAIVRQISATFSIDNLADRQYMQPLGYPALGRAVRAGVRIGL
jgi:outer membrane cobalamin receptor